jgi:hypothetical protein
VAAAADIVVVERVPGGAVDPRRLGRGCAIAREIEAGRAWHGRQPSPQQLRSGIVRAGDHRRDRVDDTGAGDLDRLRRQALKRQAGDKPAEFLGQRHGSSVSLIMLRFRGGVTATPAITGLR